MQVPSLAATATDAMRTSQVNAGILNRSGPWLFGRAMRAPGLPPTKLWLTCLNQFPYVAIVAPTVCPPLLQPNSMTRRSSSRHADLLAEQ